MKKIKFQLARHAFYDYSAIQAHLEKMAEQGWLVEAAGKYLWRYRAIKPKKLHFAVTYFADASNYDFIPTEGEEQLEAYCAKDGWRLAARWIQMQIFYNEAEHPIPIETDAVTQVETIHRTMRRNVLRVDILLLIFCIYQLDLDRRQFQDYPAEFLATPFFLYLFVAWWFILASALLEIGYYLRWYHKAKAVAQNGEFSEVKANHMASVVLSGIAILMVALACGSSVRGRWVGLFAVCVCVILFSIPSLIKARMKKKGATRAVTRATVTTITIMATVILLCGMVPALLFADIPNGQTPVGSDTYDGRERLVYNDFLPLRMEDLIESENTDWSLEQTRNESFLLSNTEYRQWWLREDMHVPWLEYTVTEVKIPLIYDACKNGLLEALHKQNANGKELFYEAVDATQWGVEDAYRYRQGDHYSNRYLLCYDNVIIEIEFDWEPTPEQMGIVAEKLVHESLNTMHKERYYAVESIKNHEI